MFFFEHADPDINMIYNIEILKDNQQYYATIYVDGFQTIQRLQATISGNSNEIDLVFDTYLPDNRFEPYTKGDVLLTFEISDSELLTRWGKIEPILESNNKFGKICFEKSHNS